MKLNNKGFAISTVLYSLLIMVFLIVTLMMSIMASNRKSTRNLVNTIEEELNRYSESATELAFNKNETNQTYTVPYGQSGWYKIELWGASGGSTTSETGVARTGGKGAYTSGLIYLKETETLYFYIGGAATGTEGGTNGGGTGAGKGMGGGGSTDVRTLTGTWNDADSIKTRLMVAAGGGGASGYKEGADGGDGGGIIGRSGKSNIDSTKYTNATYGSQKGPAIKTGLLGSVEHCNSGHIDGEEKSNIVKACGKLGIGGMATNNEGGGGGSGYLGGGAGSSDGKTVSGSGAGGSSFIAGYSGVKYEHQWSGYDKETYFSETSRTFIDGQMIEGVNEGDGKARITLVSTASKEEQPIKKNSKLQGVRYIKNCTSGTTDDQTTVSWTEIVAMQNGTNVATEGSLTNVTGVNISSSDKKKLTDNDVDTMVSITKTANTSACVTIDLSSQYNLDEITIYHNPTTVQKKSYKESIQVSSDNSNWVTLTSSDGEGISENTSGIRYTAWSIDYYSLSNGTYQIYSALSPFSRGLSAVNNNKEQDTSSNDYYSERHVKLALLGTDNLSQNWAVTSIGEGLYRIVETESNRALQIKDSLGQAGTAVNTASGYGEGTGYNWTQWKITPLGDGTYTIQTVVVAENKAPTCLATTANTYNKDLGININTCDASSLQQRWIFKSTSF